KLTAFESLRWFCHFEYSEATEEALAEFARSPNLTQLSVLELNDATVTDAGLRDFAKNTCMANLRELSLRTPGEPKSTKLKISSKGLLEVLNSKRLPRLEALTFDGISLKQFKPDVFFADAGLKKLTELRLGIPMPMSEVLACKHLSNLRFLEVDLTETTDKDTDRLLASRTFAKLESLWLGPTTRLSAASEKKLRNRFGENLTMDSDADADED
ncbi:MAG: hypothetical protein L0241_30075, partial [Planctomycetia bacterium]|nr:hypothetical protein [Planctomycetia bacterium]